MFGYPTLLLLLCFALLWPMVRPPSARSNEREVWYWTLAMVTIFLALIVKTVLSIKDSL